MTTEAAQIREIVSQRTALKREWASFEQFLLEMESGEITSQMLYLLDERLKSFGPSLREFEALQGRLHALNVSSIELEQISVENSHRFDLLFTKAHAARFAARDKLEVAANARKMDCSVQVARASTVPLPPIALPQFGGGSDQWLNFRDTFISMIHNNESLDDIRKFHYLKSSLIGTAANIIKDIPCAAASYEIAFEMICERYNNEEVLVSNHLRAFFNIPRLTRASIPSLTGLLDEAKRHLRILQSLKMPVDSWEVVVVHSLVEKLDPQTRAKWEESRSHGAVSSAELFEFLNSRIKTLETFHSPAFSSDSLNTFGANPSGFGKFKVVPKSHRHKISQSHTFISRQTADSCFVCGSQHSVFKCERFRAMSVGARWTLVKEKKLCYNCLREFHYRNRCQSGVCRECKGQHHTLLHGGAIRGQVTDESATDPITLASVTPVSDLPMTEVLLSTVRLRVLDVNGAYQSCRALLDSGSQSNFISASLFKLLGFEGISTDIRVSGIADVSTQVTSVCQLKVVPHFTSVYAIDIPCLVSDTICANLPAVSFDRSIIKAPGVRLADPQFNESKKIDMLLGAEVFWQVLCGEHLVLGKGLPVLHNSKFGYVLSGRINSSNACVETTSCNVSLSFDLQEFWRIDDVSPHQLQTDGFDFESNFLNTTTRTESGKFVVSIPFSDDVTTLGESYRVAESRFQTLERRFLRDPDFKLNYTRFIHEYLALGHMELLPSDVQPKFILPHHGVVKEESSTTRLRVVFDGSCRTSTGVSLNDIQRVGPSVQDDLFSILIRFRKHALVVSADIAKMYRCVLVDPSQRSTQCILWRDSVSLPLQIYQLNTVTYGTASAPYLATRCLRQLSIDISTSDEQVSRVIASDFYVDDLLTGFESPSDAQTVLARLFDLLSSAGFHLRKWKASNREIIQQFGETDDIHEPSALSLGADQNCKVLGLLWNHHRDVLLFKISDIDTRVASKRRILSTISQVFDPLGLLAPCIIRMKVLMQLIWLRKLDWDQLVSDDVAEQWRGFCQDLLHLNSVNVCRRAIHGEKIELHGFADASERAYGAALYARSFSNGAWTSHLLCSKTRVSPLKTVSIPRLELCAAVLLTRLLRRVYTSLCLPVSSVQLWSDSTVFLHWVQTPPRLLTTFVSNRIAEIQSLDIEVEWHHVRTADNPADYASRGLSPLDLVDNGLWWHGSSFMERHFWRRWSSEDLRGLQSRQGRSDSISIPVVGQLVQLMDDSAPPLVWTLGRITQLHPGADLVTRVVSVRTSRGTTKRAVAKLCPLPNC